MLLIHNGKFAANDKEMIESLFSNGGTAKGFYKKTRGGIKLFNMQHELFAFVVNNKYDEQFFVSATMKDGKPWYNYGLDDIAYKYIFNTPVSYSTERDIAKEVIKQAF